MASASMNKRIAALESRNAGFNGPAIWTVCEPGESPADAVARYEAEHGPRLPGQLAITWRVVPCAA